jgi:hypothetical protein
MKDTAGTVTINSLSILEKQYRAPKLNGKENTE